MNINSNSFYFVGTDDDNTSECTIQLTEYGQLHGMDNDSTNDSLQISKEVIHPGKTFYRCQMVGGLIHHNLYTLRIIVSLIEHYNVLLYLTLYSNFFVAK